MAEVRAAHPLPPISGSTDIYPNSQAIAVAYNLDYRPRPIFQSYAAYTPKLAGVNLAYLQSDKAPQNILFDVQTIDMRLPPLDDGDFMAQLLTRYDVAGLYDSMALLEVGADRKSHTLTPLTSITGKLGETISVPATADGPIWAEIDVKLSLCGKLEELFYLNRRDC